MIEVEKHFILQPGDTERLIASADYGGTTTNTDTYYDTPTYSLTTSDRWLRNRNGGWELKVGLVKGAEAKQHATVYRELETEPEIRQELALATHLNFADALKEKGYAPYASWKTTRMTYRIDDLTIVLDSVDFGYELAEIELLVDKNEHVAAATQRIAAFAEERGLTPQLILGKNAEYLRRHNPKHYQALVTAGVV